MDPEHPRTRDISPGGTTQAPPLRVGRWKFRDDVQGLRALAIVLVVIYHAQPAWLPGGFLGVDVFFVVSGYLITGIIVDEVARTGRLSLAGFWGRRARRLMPAAVAMIAVTLALATYLSSPFALELHAKTATLAALYGSNFLFLGTNADYFAINTQPNLLLHTWSLSVEEQFYLVYAPLLAVIGWTCAGTGIARFRRTLSVVLALLTLASFALCLWLASRNRVMSFYVLPTRWWELGVGAILAVHGGWLARRVDRFSETVAWVALVALGAVLVAAMVADEHSAHPGWITIVPVAATAAFIVVGMAARSSPVTRLLSTRPFGAVGELSYSWYLWHWPLLVLLGEVVAYPTATQRVAVLLLSLGIAWGSYRWIEAPVHRSPRLAAYPRLSIVAALGLSALVALAGRKAWGHAGRQSERLALRAARESSARPAVRCLGVLPTSPDDRLCEFGRSDAERTLVIFGDSHMVQWFSALEPVAREDGWRLVVAAESGCPAPIVTVEMKRWHRPDTECDVWRRGALALVGRLRPDLVLVSSWHEYRVMLDGEMRLTSEDTLALDAWERGTDSTLRVLAQSADRVVLIRDTPIPGIVVRDCLTTRLADPARCAAPRALALDTRVVEREREVVSRIPGVRFADFTETICDDTQCPAVLDDIIVYRDTHHLSNAFAATFAPQFRALLASAENSSGGSGDSSLKADP